MGVGEGGEWACKHDIDKSTELLGEYGWERDKEDKHAGVANSLSIIRGPWSLPTTPPPPPFPTAVVT